MFESSLLAVLAADSTLTDYLSTYGSRPAIFSNSAPAQVDFDYMVFTISDTGNGDSVVNEFRVSIDFFGYGKSGANIRSAIRRTIELLDRTHLTHDYYDSIRLFKGGIEFIETEDPKAQHYNLEFTARAGRSGWMDEISS